MRCLPILLFFVFIYDKVFQSYFSLWYIRATKLIQITLRAKWCEALHLSRRVFAPSDFLRRLREAIIGDLREASLPGLWLLHNRVDVELHWLLALGLLAEHFGFALALWSVAGLLPVAAGKEHLVSLVSSGRHLGCLCAELERTLRLVLVARVVIRTFLGILGTFLCLGHLRRVVEEVLLREVALVALFGVDPEAEVIFVDGLEESIREAFLVQGWNILG